MDIFEELDDGFDDRNDKNKRNRGKKNKRKSSGNVIKMILQNKVLGMVISLVQLIISVFMLAYIADIGLLPAKYFWILAAVLFVLFLIPAVMQLVGKLSIVFKVVSLLMSGILLFVHFSYIKPAADLLKDISDTDTQKVVLALYVLNDDEANDVTDLKDYVVGYIGGPDLEPSKKYLKELAEEAKGNFETREFALYEDAVVALFDKEINALVMNTAYVDLITDSDAAGHLDEEMRKKFLAFTTLTKVVTEIQYEEVIKPNDDKDDKPYVRPEVTSEPFCLYISGIDTHGSVNRRSRSDVNILAFVNPKTKQVLLVSTPRDSYVVNPYSNGEKDKLTHAGIYGIDSSMGALGELYGLDIDFFFRVNFTGFTKIIDALGGVSVNSAVTFNAGGYSFTKGINEMDGKKALVFCRERHAFAGGDRQRGKNQMAVITAVVKKMASSKLLTNYSEILSSLNGTFQTSLTSDEISSLIKMQLNDMSSWNIQTYSVDGKGSMEYTHTSPNGKRSVIILDETTIAKAKVLIEQVYSGKTISIY